LTTLLQGVGWFNNSPQAVPLYAKQAQRGGRGIALPPVDFGARRVWVNTVHPGCFTSRKETGYSFYRRLNEL